MAALICSTGFPSGGEYCPVKEMLLYQSELNLHFIHSGKFFLSLDLLVIVSFSHLSYIQTVVCRREYYYF